MAKAFQKVLCFLRLHGDCGVYLDNEYVWHCKYCKRALKL